MKCKHCKINDVDISRSKYWCGQCLDKNKEYCHEYYVQHKEKFLEKNRKRRREKASEMKEYARSWTRKNREKCNKYRQKRRTACKRVEENHKNRARKFGILNSSFSKEEWKFLLNFYGNRCLSCGTDKKLEPDHVIPLSKGGLNIMSNIQPLCRSCNSKKGAKTIDYRSVIISIEYLK